MLNVRRFLSRRCLLGFLAAALLLGLAMLHPYPRQSLFGPTIRGKPMCVWEETVRRQFGERPESLVDRARHWLGVKPEWMNLEDFDDPAMLPLVAELLEDSDALVRSTCIGAVSSFANLQDRSLLPALWHRFENDEMEIRAQAGTAIWRIDRDEKVLVALLKLADDPDHYTRLAALSSLVRISETTPALYPHLVAHAKDVEPVVRARVMYGMMNFGKRGVPILIDGLNDPDPGVQYAAVMTAHQLGPDARAALPALEACLKVPFVAPIVPAALRAVDPERAQRRRGDR